MFGRSEKTETWMAPDGEPVVPFLEPEGSEPASSVVGELRDRLAKLEQQVLAQYTATAAYATLSHQNVETARAEARSDLDRSQSTIIGLLDRLRTEMNARMDGIETRPSAPASSLGVDAAARLAMLEDRMGSIINALDSCIKENILLRQQVNELLQSKMQQDGWLVSSGGTSDLSLR
jgi:hypothetical protein